MLRYIIYFITVFVILFSISYIHYWLSQGFEKEYYLFFYGFAGMFLGSAILLKWSNVESPNQLADKLNKTNDAEKEDQNSLKYGTLVLFPSMISVIFALSNIDFQ